MYIADEMGAFLKMCEVIEEKPEEEHSFLVSATPRGDENYVMEEVEDSGEYEIERDGGHIRFSHEYLIASVRAMRDANKTMIMVHSHSELDITPAVGFSQGDLQFEETMRGIAEQEGYRKPIFFMVLNLSSYSIHGYWKEKEIEDVRLRFPYGAQKWKDEEVHVFIHGGRGAVYRSATNELYRTGKESAELIRGMQKSNEQEEVLSSRLALQRLFYEMFDVKYVKNCCDEVSCGGIIWGGGSCGNTGTTQ